MEPPTKPSESDCCNSGCNPCIFDVYEEQLKKYNASKDQNLQLSTRMKNCMSATSYTKFKLANVTKHTRNTLLYTFAYINLSNSDSVGLFYTPGQHFLLRGENEDKYFTRAYTPIPLTKVNDLLFTVLIRLYDKGKMSEFLRNLAINSETFWRGPYGDYIIKCDLKHILFIAQGTGIAPIFSVIHALLNNNDCYTFLKLFFCCGNSDDILLHNELYRLSEHWNFTYEIFLNDKEHTNRKYNEVQHSEHLNFEHILGYLNGKQGDKLEVLICGSDDFSQIIKHSIIKCNVDCSKIFIF